MSWYIRKQDIQSLAIGAKAISSGGGGDPKTVEALLMSIMDSNDLIEVKSVVDLSEDLVLGIGVMGSTVLYSENIPCGQEGVKAVKLYESIVQSKVSALVPIEIGGVNALTPLATAVQSSLPVIDGDAMGRAFPELNMTTFNLSGIPITPMILQTQNANHVIYGPKEVQKVSQIAKDFIFNNGGYAHFVCFGAKGNKIRSSVIPGTLNFILRLGNIIRDQSNIIDKKEKITSVLENSIYGRPNQIVNGVISKVNRWFEKGLLIGKFTVEGQSSISRKNVKVEIEFKNEFVSIKEENYICTTPDIIMVLNKENLFPYSVSEIQEGLSITVFAVRAPNILRTKEMLKRVGPGSFDIDGYYKNMTT